MINTLTYKLIICLFNVGKVIRLLVTGQTVSAEDVEGPCPTPDEIKKIKR